MFFRSDDPVADFNRWDAEQEEKLERLPKCTECGEHIQQERAVCINGDWYCDKCLDDIRLSKLCFLQLIVKILILLYIVLKTV